MVEINIKTMATAELKALAYDMLSELSRIQAKVNLIDQEIRNRPTEEPESTPEPKTAK
jgi:hypothetical protein